jgi:hypothetical protein
MTTTKQKLSYEIVCLEDYTRGTLFVANSATARANKAVFERHLSAEWASDIETTMATIHRDNPYQRIPALGVDIDSFEGIREFYLRRFETWPGPALPHFDRCTVTDECIYVEGTFQIQSSGEFSGLNITGTTFSTPCIIVLECRDGLLVGEIVYMDGAALKQR